MVSVDQYVNETNRHADVILPPVSALERDEVDVALPLVAIRNHIRFSPAAVPKREGGKEDWEILNGTHEAPRARDRDQGASVLARRAAGVARSGGRIGDRRRPLRDPPPRPDRRASPWDASSAPSTASTWGR